jgi:hypothetical protein
MNDWVRAFARRRAIVYVVGALVLVVLAWKFAVSSGLPRGSTFVVALATCVAGVGFASFWQRRRLVHKRIETWVGYRRYATATAYRCVFTNESQRYWERDRTCVALLTPELLRLCKSSPALTELCVVDLHGVVDTAEERYRPWMGTFLTLHITGGAALHIYVPKASGLPALLRRGQRSED